MANDADCILTGRGTIAATGAPCTNLGPAAQHELIFTSSGRSAARRKICVSFGTYIGTLGAVLWAEQLGSGRDRGLGGLAYSGLGTAVPDSSAAGGTWLEPAGAVGQRRATLPGNAFGLGPDTEGSWAGAATARCDMMMGYIARY